MIKRLMDSARRGNKMRLVSGPGYGSWSGMPFFGAVGEGLDYNKEAGNRWDNSIVWACLSFGVRVLNACPIQTGVLNEELAFEPIKDHPITQLLNRPNDWYDGTLLQTAQIWGEMARGNSYAYVHRSGAGIITALEALPEGSCMPFTQPGSGDFVSCYMLQTTSGSRQVPVENILHLRWMIPHPFYLALGMSPLESCLPEVVSDKKTGRLRSALLNNSGVSASVISPKGGGREGEFEEFTQSQERQIEQKVRDKISQDNVGLPLVFNVPMDLQNLSFDPSQLGLEAVTKHDEERICAVFGIQPLAVCLGAGLERQNNRAGAETAIDATFDSFILPYIEHRERQLTQYFVPELGLEHLGGQEVIRYDRSRLPAIKARLVREIMLKTGGPIETPNEGRGQLGLKPVDGGDTLRQAKASADSGGEGRQERRMSEGDD